MAADQGADEVELTLTERKAELEHRIAVKCVQCQHGRIVAGQLHCNRKTCRYKTVRRWLAELKRLEAQA